MNANSQVDRAFEKIARLSHSIGVSEVVAVEATVELQIWNV